MHIFAILALLVIFPIYSEEIRPLPTRDEVIETSCASTEGILSTIVANQVSAITGELVDCQTDLFLAGPEPIVWQRSYSSNPSVNRNGFDPLRNNKIRHYYPLWQFLSACNAYYQVDEKGYSSTTFFALVPHSTASLLTHTGVTHHRKDYHLLKFDTQKGWTNCSSGSINARTNPKNVRIALDADKGQLFAQYGSGDRRYYQTSISETHDHTTIGLSALKKEIKANGNQLIYNKDGFDLQAMNKDGTTLFGWIKKVPISNLELKIENSHSDPITYKYTEKKSSRIVNNKLKTFSQALLTSVERPDKPTENYKYIRLPGEGERLLAKKSLPEQRYIIFEYYKPGDITGELNKVPIEKSIDPRKGRVKCLKAPVGSDTTPIVTHRFYYDLNIEFHKDRYAKVGKGWTTVYNANNHKTKYYYNDSQRLTTQLEYSGDSPYLYTNYLWVDDESDPKAGLLMGKVVKSDHEVQYGRFFKYDERGNILKEKFCGNLTGNCNAPLILKGHNPEKNGVEAYTKKFTYSSDPYNLLHSETDHFGKSITYSYYPNSDLLKTKLIHFNKKVLLREFYEYDHNNILTRHISDDGSGNNVTSLTNVTCRKITVIHPTKEIPIGLPECVEEKYWDGTHEKTLKTIRRKYSKEGYLLEEQIYDEEGVFRFALKKEYDAHGNIIKEIDAIGQMILRKYDANDNLIFEQGPAFDCHFLHYYDYANRKVRTEEVREGASFNTYFRYDYLGNLISKIDRLGQETVFRYDEHGRLIETIYPEVVFEGNLVHPTEKKEYNVFGDCITEINAAHEITSKTFNARGKPVQITHPNGHIEKFEYRLDGLLTKKQFSHTFVHYEYDRLDRIILETITDLDGNPLSTITNTYKGSQLISSTDAMGVKTNFTYDFAGRLTTKRCLEKQETYQYDSLGRITKKIQSDRVTSIEYDLLDRILKESILDLEGNVLKSISYQYDARGNRTHVTEETASGQSCTITEFNPDNHPVKITDPEGNVSHIVYDYQFRNSVGQQVLQVRQTDPLGRITSTTFDTINRPVLVEKWDAFGTLIISQETLYDLKGNPISTIDRFNHQLIQTKMTYNTLNQLTCIIEAVGRPEQKVTRYTYNIFGECVAQHKPDGIVLYSDYDVFGRLVDLKSNDKSLHHHYEYNLRHHPTRISDLIAQNHTLLIYDSHGRVIKEQLAHGLSLNYTYDEFDRVLSVILPDQSTILYRYDCLYLREIRRGAFVHYYDEYDQSGNFLKGRSLFNEPVLRTYTLSKQPRLWHDPNWFASDFEYDATRKLTGVKAEGKFSFQYDALDHLTSEPHHQYECDALHRRQSKNGVTHTYNDLHQLLEFGETRFEYDLNGNLIKKTTNNQVTTFKYDALDRLTESTSNSTTRYSYDPLHRRLNKNNERYLYIGQNEIGSLDTGQIRVLCPGESEIGSTVAIEINDKVYSVSHDYRGNIVSLSNPQETHSYQYTAFGEKIVSANINNPWQFSGKRFDPETGLVYFGRRYYDPETARWITPDPLGMIDGPNLYTYLRHSFRNFDNFGLNEEPREEPSAPITHVDYREERKTPSNNESAEQNLSSSIDQKRARKRQHFWVGAFALNQLGICIVNGIQNNFDSAMENAMMVCQMADHKCVDFVHNNSLGFFGSDLTRCFMELYFWKDTQSVNNLKETWDSLLEQAQCEKILTICHSEGSIVVRNALKSYPMMSKIQVASFAPAAYIDDKGTAGVQHYRSEGDFVPMIDFVGAWKCRNTTKVLKPHPEAPWFDHAFSSPTYRNVLREEVFNFINNSGK